MTTKGEPRERDPLRDAYDWGVVAVMLISFTAVGLPVLIAQDIRKAVKRD